MPAKERITNLVKLIGGDTREIYKDRNECYQYKETVGELDIRITNSDHFDTPWVDIYHFKVGPVALYRVTDDDKAAELIEEYKEIFLETADAH